MTAPSEYYPCEMIGSGAVAMLEIRKTTRAFNTVEEIKGERMRINKKQI